MFKRPALLAALLVSGSAAVAVAQSDEFPFRRFGSRYRIEVPRDAFRYRFSLRDNERFRVNAERAHSLAARARLRNFSARDLSMRLRNRGVAMRDQARRHQMEFRFRDLDRVRGRLRDRMDRFRFERPLMRRHARTI